MKRVLALLIAAAIVTGGCSIKKEEPLPPVPSVDSAINIQLGGEPEKLDPAFAVTTAEQSYIIHLFEGLTNLDDKLQPTAGVAESWERVESDAGIITYTFKLDQNAKWSDGAVVKPEDFIYAWKRVLDPATKSPLAYRLYPISGAKAVNQDSADPTTLGVAVTEEGALQVTLEGECPDFLQRLATAPWMPLRESVVKAKPTGWYYDTAKYLTNGAYTLEEWERDQRITMARSDSYRDTKNVKAKKINFVLMEDEAALMASFKDGAVQLATNLPLLDLEAMDKETLRTDTLLGSYILAFNTANQPLSDARVRRALSLAIDRSIIVAEQRDGSVAATGLVPDGALVGSTDLRDSSGNLIPDVADLEKAKKLLKDAGFEGGKGIEPIKFLINDEDVHRRVAEAIAKMWEPLGITVEVKMEKWDTYLAMREDGKFDVTRAALFSDDLYPSAFLDNWTGDSQLNFTGYNSKEYNALIDESYGRKPKEAEAAVEGANDTTKTDDKKTDTTKTDIAKTDDKKTDTTKTDTAKTDDKKTDTTKTDTSKTDDKKTDDKKGGEAESEDILKSPIDCLTTAEKLLVETDAVIAPLTWYTNRYAVAPGMVGIRSYPTGYMYFGRASYSKPSNTSK